MTLNGTLHERFGYREHCNIYCETGTGEGNSLRAAYPHFERCYSVDLDPVHIENAKRYYDNCTFECSTSVDALRKWLSSGEFLDTDSVFFFLDAHFPNADYRGATYDINAPNAVPLEEEIRLIMEYRPNGKDIIVCDDARLYVDGKFENPVIESLLVPTRLSFLDELKIDYTVDFGNEGYIIINRL